MRIHIASLTSLFVLTAFSAQSQAEAPKISATISPLHLFANVLEASVEYSPSPQVSAALIAGGGKIDDVSVIEVGGQLRYYVYRPFAGLHLGGELLYLTATGENDNITADGNGLGIGTFLGYKWIHNSGLTLEAQGGVNYINVEATGSDGSQASERKVGPLLNLNAGWSF